MLLFIPSLLAHDYESFYTKLGVVVLIWFVVIAASMVDLIAGIQASHRTGTIKTHSWGLRKTLTKDLQYFGVLTMLLFIDFASSALSQYIALFQVPIFSVAGVLCITIIEALSVKENIQKGRTKEESKIDDIEDTLKLIIKVIGKDKARKTIQMLSEQIEKKEL